MTPSLITWSVNFIIKSCSQILLVVVISISVRPRLRFFAFMNDRWLRLLVLNICPAAAAAAAAADDDDDNDDELMFVG
jgi:hypothetical protein